MVLKFELNAKNKITAVRALGVSVFRYSLGIVSWRLEEVRNTDGKTRKVLTMYKIYHPKADTDRLYVKKKEGIGGLLQMKQNIKQIQSILQDI
jgi:hypothetical protein